MTERQIRAMWVSIAALASVIISMVGGFLEWRIGHSIPAAVLYGAGAFAASITVILGILGVLGAFEIRGR
ncbi:hypothetical protein [Actinomadura gamaensis]|uniref:Major facilitator superfamily (MFS) profile domain-containing protein n=1 Tax=Actinomadura gamaensis TaxID=1763541 RepID=A0ABV9U002_9ACTN